MDQFDLQSDPCDNRLIRCNNCLQLLACFCDILAMIDESFRALAFFFDHLADLVYHTVSGCMTAQVCMLGLGLGLGLCMTAQVCVCLSLYLYLSLSLSHTYTLAVSVCLSLSHIHTMSLSL